MSEIEKIAKFEIFNDLNTDEINNILLLGQEVEYEDEVIIFEDSSLPSDFFILLEGRASVEIDVSHGEKNGRKKVQLAILRNGDVFGEIGLLEGKRRLASVKAIAKVLVLKINGNKLTEYFAENTNTGYRLMRNLARILSQRITDVVFMLRDDIRRIL
ncbi:MAG: cyclic nucleotide-binding domain-containing protein [Deltaproteobacteria bacterium]|nr:MAG: cyclic nucleotide-binding domain-containing protein [Deltaproteobacteria bacterium]